jgi:hypothetical protein
MESQIGLVKSRLLQPPLATQEPAPPKEEVLHALAGLLCVANEILAAWAPVFKCEAAIQAYEKCNEAIKKGCYPHYPPAPYTTYSPPAAQAAAGGTSGSQADVWHELARLLQICTYAAQQWVASYKRQPYTEPEESSTKATEEERKPASHAPRSGPK